MNSIQRINRINQQELDNNVSDAASWHRDYKDTLYVYIGNLNKKLLEKDVVIIFSQYGIPTHIKMMKTEDGLCKGWCYLKYETFDSCVLAVDNFNGITVYDQKIRVDHCWFKLREGETEEQYLIDYDEWVPRKKALGWKEEKAKDLKRIEGAKKQVNNDGTEEVKDLKKLDGLEDPINDLKDPMDDFKDPMDDFKDPMESFTDRTKSGDRNRSKKTKGNDNAETKPIRERDDISEPQQKRQHKNE